MVVVIRKGSHHSEESKKKIRKNHWSKSDVYEEVVEKIIDANIGKVPWNKGKEMTPEYCKNAGNGRRGKPAWNKGKTGIYSEETLERMSEHHKGKPTWNVGKKRTWYTNGFKDHKHSDDTKLKMSEQRLGSGNANWRGGISFEPYYHKFNDKFKEYVREKFNRVCFICGISESDHLPDAKKSNRLYIHHINYDKRNICDEYSWMYIPLCASCHSKTNGNRWYWFNKYINYWVYNYIDFTNTLSLIY